MKLPHFFTFLAITCSSYCGAQTPNLVEPDVIQPGLHANNMGKILFTGSRVANENLPNDSFLTAYTLTNKSSLFFVAYFDNSLTNYKHRLAPGVPADSLYKLGNYQFSLLVDGHLVYQSNLLPGAPPVKSQDKDVFLNRPLIDNISGQGTWSESFWNRFMNNGGDQALTEGPHVLRMEIRPYVKTPVVVTGPVMAAGELPVQVVRRPTIDVSTIKLNRPAPYNGFAVSTAPFDTTKIKALKGAINEGIFKKINSVVVIKNGQLLIEEYFNGATRNTLHDPRSVGKSFASTVMGQAIADGYIQDEHQTLARFYRLQDFQHYSPQKEKTSIRDLLTMSSVFDGNDEDGQSPGNEENMYPAPDWVQFTLDLPARQDTNRQWHYFTAGVVLLGDILNKTVPGGLEAYADAKLFNPLGITNYKWQYTPQQVPNTAGGIRMNALDFAKYGQLYKNGGVWNKKRLLSTAWVNKSFSKQQPITGRDHEYYGYLFWNKIFIVAGKPYEAFYCAGNGGNYILVFKDQPVVIVITASAYGQPYAHKQVADMLTNYILPAVVK